MSNAIAWVFYKNECKRRQLTLATGTLLFQMMPLATTPIPAHLYSLEQLGTFAFSITLAASLALATARRYEVSATLAHEGTGADSKLSLHTLDACAPGASPWPKDLERIE